jgi:hypothetical protein
MCKLLYCETWVATKNPSVMTTRGKIKSRDFGDDEDADDNPTDDEINVDDLIKYGTITY